MKRCDFRVTAYRYTELHFMEGEWQLPMKLYVSVNRDDERECTALKSTVLNVAFPNFLLGLSSE